MDGDEDGVGDGVEVVDGLSKWFSLHFHAIWCLDCLWLWVRRPNTQLPLILN